MKKGVIMTLNELKGELALVRERRREIAAMVHPSQCKKEYIRLMHREREIVGEIEFRYMIGADMRKAVFRC